jgi:hypothetical protein
MSDNDPKQRRKNDLDPNTLLDTRTFAAGAMIPPATM